MTQVTWRANPDVVDRVRRAAKASGRSMNEFVTFVMDAATNPDLGGDERERIRERLRAAGLLFEPTPLKARRRPPRDVVEAARRAAGSGTPLSELVSRDRG